MAYYEICERLNDGWSEDWHDEHKVPYAFKDNQCVGYENMRSLKEKVDYAKRKKLGGLMFWSIDMDDFSGSVCRQGKYPIVKNVRDLYLFDNLKKTKINQCYNGDGFYLDLRDGCQHYYICEFTKTPSFRIQRLTCPEGSLFDKRIIACNFKQFVDCN